MDFEIDWTIDLPNGWEYQGNCQVDVKLGFIWVHHQESFMIDLVNGDEINADNFLHMVCLREYSHHKFKAQLDDEAISRGYIEPDPGHGDLNWMDTKI